eukprot:ctg_191.g86
MAPSQPLATPESSITVVEETCEPAARLHPTTYAPQPTAEPASPNAISSSDEVAFVSRNNDSDEGSSSADDLLQDHPWKTPAEVRRSARHIRKRDRQRARDDRIRSFVTVAPPTEWEQLQQAYAQRWSEYDRDTPNRRATTPTAATDGPVVVVDSSASSNGNEWSPAARDLRDLQRLLDEGQQRSEETPELPTPIEFEATVSLLQHQRQALAWMVNRETSTVTSDCRGGILADEQGLGKTLTTLALIAAHRPPTDKRSPTSVPRRTLIICPLSVMSQWAREVRDKFADVMRPSVLVYHGSGRPRNVDGLRPFDIVLTTYAVAASECPRQTADGSIDTDSAGPLFRQRWFRVVLDEAQHIKNRFSQVARAVCLFEADCRWCVTGTPIQNNVDDVYSLCVFLRYPLVRDGRLWNRLFKRTTESRRADRRASGLQRLHAALHPLLLRRRKSDIAGGDAHATTLPPSSSLLQLPPRIVMQCELQFTPQEREFYDGCESREREEFLELLREGSVVNHYMHVLVMLTRLRQLCNHFALVRRDEESQVELAQQLQQFMESGGRGIGTQAQARLWQMLNRPAECLCAVCADVVQASAGVITRCGHVFCGECLRRWLDERHSCPLCRRPCRPQSSRPLLQVREQLQQHFVPSAEAASPQPAARCRQKLPLSTKLEALVTRVLALIRDTPDEKCLVFSQWTQMLDLCEDALLDRHVPVCRLDGSMSRDERQTNLELFRRPDFRLMLVSLRAGGVGLNLTEANHVFLLDAWWNPAVEEQAMDRVHRIGQRRPVHVVRFTIANTVEQRILALQQKKREMFQEALNESPSTVTARRRGRLTLSDLRLLFNAHTDGQSGA